MIDKALLEKGKTIYNRQPRFFDYDYHPQVITEINEDSIEVFEEGYSPVGKTFTIPIRSLQIEGSGDQSYIIH